MRAARARGLILGAGAAGNARWPGRAGMVGPPRGRRLLAAGRALVRGALRHADAGAGGGVAGHRPRRGHAHRRAHRLGKDARRLPLVARPPGARRRGRRARGAHRRRLRLAAEGARQRRAAEPRPPARRDARAGRGGGHPAARDPRPGALRRHARRRAPGDGAPPAPHPGDHAGVALHPADGRGQPALARRRADRGRGRDPRRRRRQARRAPGPLARAPGRARGAAAPAHRPLRHAASHRGGGAPARRRGGAAPVRDRRRRAPPGPRPRDRGARPGARADRHPRAVGRHLRPHRRPGARAPDDHRVRQHAPPGRAGRAPARGAPGRGARGRAPRQHGAADAARGRGAPQGGRGAGGGRDRLARARHRRGRRRPRLPRGRTARARDAHPARRPLGPRARGGAEGRRLPPDARRPGAGRGRGARRPGGSAGHAPRAREPARHPGPAVRGHGRDRRPAGRGAVGARPAGVLFPRPFARRFRRRPRHAGRRRGDPARPARRAAAPRPRARARARPALRAAVAARLPDTSWLVEECGLSADAAAQLGAYVGATEAALGTVPTTGCVVAERFFDEAGGMQLVVHAPFGGRINRAWGLALRKRFCVTFNFELQAAATDDGLVISLGEQHSFPLDSVFAMVRSETLREDLVQAALASPLFTNRWRWNATRSLALLRHQGGRRVPMPLQRMRAEDLLAAVFPEQAACADNLVGPITVPEHPLVRETIDNCLHEAMDVDGLAEVLACIGRGQVATRAVDTAAPSPMSHEILNSNPYTYLDDAPLEERRARAVALRRTDPDLAAGLGALEPAAIAEVRAQAWPDVRDADELHDALLSMVLVPAVEIEAAGWSGFAAELAATGRATWGETGALRALVAVERLPVARAAVPGLRADLDWPGAEPGREEALLALLGGWLECVGPATAEGLAARTGLSPSAVAIGLAGLERAGIALRGRFTPDAGGEEWCERRLLARIHRLTLGRLPREIEPVSDPNS